MQSQPPSTNAALTWPWYLHGRKAVTFCCESEAKHATHRKSIRFSRVIAVTTLDCVPVRYRDGMNYAGQLG